MLGRFFLLDSILMFERQKGKILHITVVIDGRSYRFVWK